MDARSGSKQAASRFHAAIGRLRDATPLTRHTHVPQVCQAAQELASFDAGLHEIYEQAHLLEACGFFKDTPWEHPTRLQPRLVAGGLMGDQPTSMMELLSEVRMLAIATGKAERDDMDRERALRFLERVVALNLDLLFGRETEEQRMRGSKPERQGRATRLFRFILDQLPQAQFLHLVVQEIEEICAQRRVWTAPVRRMIRLASELPGAAESDNERLTRYVEAVLGPSPMSRRFHDVAEYRTALQQADEPMLEEECRAMAGSLHRTGLACPQHAVLLRHLRDQDADTLRRALGLDEKGAVELARGLHLVRDLITTSVYPGNEQAIYGLAMLLERGLTSWPDVQNGLRELAELPLRPDVEQTLRNTQGAGGLSPHAILVGGIVRVLGQPLGIGQGRNPTCQAARGMSLWSQHAPGYLLQLITAAVRDGDLVFRFQDQDLRSGELQGGLAWDFDPMLDPVSAVLVPHLDRIYDEMMRRVAHLPGEGHQWVNPAMYGRIVPLGFATCFDPTTWQVHDYKGFLRQFWATHHPEYNGGKELAYPNPVGILVTTSNADLLGLHAVSIQRVAEDPDGTMRVYFFNPNDEGRQDWGQGIEPSIWRHGEREGESSLPFGQFASRLYAFHYNPFEEGDGYAVPEEALQEVEVLARQSWGTSYSWLDAPA